MRVNLTIDVTSRDGEVLRRELSLYQDILDFECSCPEGRSCDVSVEQVSAGSYKVNVTRSGYSIPPKEWVVLKTKNECRYARTFRNPSADAVAAAVVELIEKPLVLPAGVG